MKSIFELPKDLARINYPDGYVDLSPKEIAEIKLLHSQGQSEAIIANTIYMRHKYPKPSMVLPVTCLVAKTAVKAGVGVGLICTGPIGWLTLAVLWAGSRLKGD